MQLCDQFNVPSAIRPGNGPVGPMWAFGDMLTEQHTQRPPTSRMEPQEYIRYKVELGTGRSGFDS
jgi:hypothetical protein